MPVNKTSGKYEEAVPGMSKSGKKVPTVGDLQQLAQSSMKNGDPQTAMATMKQAARLQPGPAPNPQMSQGMGQMGQMPQ